ncbi:MAG TPA: cysteine desulfurase [Spirochaetaceae bacterium]|nr:cysteine desulfurase [Spirochaetaceae bacterium]
MGSSGYSGGFRRTFLDNASSSFPRAPGIKAALNDYLNSGIGNIGRGQYRSAYDLEEKVMAAREAIAAFFNAHDPSAVVFTSGGTASLNMFLKGFLKKGDHVIVSPLEHNAVMRPLDDLRAKGVIEYSIAPIKDGVVVASGLEPLIRPNTKAVICNHASNVSGSVQDIEAVGMTAHEHGLAFCVDSCQSAGCVGIDVRKSHIDFLAFTGHKGLLGLPGIGGAVVGGIAVEPLIRGGTGSLSDSFDMPVFLPDRFEAGTQNIPGILSVGCGIDFINSVGLDKIRSYKRELRKRFIGLISKGKLAEFVSAVGSEDIENVGIVSISVKSHDIACIANALDMEYGVCTRVGLQCAPLAHKSLGTFEGGGTIRFSFSYFNTVEDVEIAVAALSDIVSGVHVKTR